MATYTCEREDAVRDLRTVRDFLRWSVSQFEAAGVFYGHGTDNAWDEACALVFSALHLPWDIQDSILDGRLTQDERVHLADLVYRRTIHRIPVPYLVKEAWFCNYSFQVDERVLIPRSPIGELIGRGFQPWIGAGKLTRALDLCTGSGCIGIATALAFPDARIDLCDLSSDALQLAQLNVAQYGVENRVRVIQGDLFSAVSDQRYDLILCNPPYVDDQDLGNMPAEFHHEPRNALTGGGDGLELVRVILASAASFLRPDGILILEVGNSSCKLVEQFPEVPFFWFDFEHGGHGVCMLSAAELLTYQAQFAAAAA